jgi:type IV secretory pathway TraG/TraD family ATPase VirD4
VLFLIDEGGVTPVPELHDHVSTLNGRGMSFMIGIQALSQLDAVYKENAETILNNCVQVFSRQQSFKTAEAVSILLGGKSAFSSSHTTHGDQTSEGKQEQKVPLMTPQQIRGMGDAVLIFHPDLRYAIKAKRMPEFVKPEVVPDYPRLLPPAPVIPLLPAPQPRPNVDTWRRATEAYPLFFAEQ